MMKSLIKRREVLRQVFNEYAAKSDDSEWTLEALSDKATRLFALDAELHSIENFVESPEFDGDVQNCEKIKEKYFQLKAKYKDVPEDGTKGNSIHRFTKLVPRKFDLKPSNWCAFWGQFKGVYEDKKIVTEDKFSLLLQCLVTDCKAYKIVESYPPLKVNFAVCIEHLKRRFGRDELVIDAAIRDILSIIDSTKVLAFPELVDFLNTQIRILKGLGVGSDKYEIILYPLLEKCVPDDVLALWLDKRAYPPTDDIGEDNAADVADDSSTVSALEGRKIDKFLAFLEKQVESREHIEGLKEKTKAPMTAAALHTGTRTQKAPSKAKEAGHQCIFCDNKHRSDMCRQALKMDLAERRRIVQERRACYRCLSVLHSAKACREGVCCVICSKLHVAIVCPLGKETGFKKDDEKAGPSTPLAAAGTTSNAPADPNVSASCSSQSRQPKVYLKTFAARIIMNNRSTKVRLFIDDGSQRSYLRQELAQMLNLVPVNTVYISQGLFGAVQTPTVKRSVYDIEVAPLGTGPPVRLSVMDQERICHVLPTVPKNILEEFSRRGVEVKDTPHAEIDILIGSDAIGSLLTGQLIVHKGLVATETKLGWTISGARKNDKVVTMSFFDLESLGITAETGNNLEDYKNDVKINEDGRMIVGLPWISDHPPLPTNFVVARSRLDSTIVKLNRLNLFDEYNKVFQSWEQQDIIERVEEESTGNVVHYLPHHPVLKDSKTTPVRPVFDASCRDKGASLNDCLHKGPNLLPTMLSMLHRFRQRKVALTADIAKAFLAIELMPNDRNVVRFLWKEKEDGELVIFRHKRVVFGVAPSSFLLISCLQRLFELYGDNDCYRWVISILKDSFYVDNCLATFENLDKAIVFKSQATEILAAHHFELRAWNSNAPELRAADGNVIENVLGLNWNIESDTLSLKLPDLKVLAEGVLTKRKVLAICNAIFDPLGIVAPVTLVPKMLLSKLWKENYDWDDDIDAELATSFRTWLEQLPLLKDCEIPRCIFSTKEGATLHFFSDASAQAFAVVVFLVVDGSVKFVVAKTRIAPAEDEKKKKKLMTIPRLELMGVCIAARIYKGIKESWDVLPKTYFWTDSTCVLGWLKSNAPFKTFVSNRTKEIRKLTEGATFRHVPGNMNPCDIASRGCSALELLRAKWIEGPEWLLKPEEWPGSEEQIEITLANVEVESDPVSKKLLFKVSRYTILLGVVAWMRRFTHNARKKNRHARRLGSTLSADEYKGAETALFHLIQMEWPMAEKRKCELRITKKKNGILCLKTKITKGEEYLTEPPVLVDNPIVRLFIFHLHKKMGHASVNTTLLKCRESGWLIQGRKITREVIKSCGRCRRFDGRPLKPIEAPLPEFRFDTSLGCFQKSGVDLGGPLYLANGEKVWFVLFTCATYRAVHVELVSSLSTEAFLQALRRFIARRGSCDVLYCDCGTNFIGAKNAFEELDWESIRKEGAVQCIEIKPNCPAAPWFGGFWEIMVKAIKNVLKRCLGNASLTYEELLTVLCDAERIVNSRPLTYVSEDPEDLKPITPEAFLIDRRSDVDKEIDALDKVDLNLRVAYCNKLREDLKARFQREYLSGLVQFARSKPPKKELAVGDIVLIETDDKKRQLWPLARVVNIFKGRDGICRVAQVKTANGMLTRPISRLIPLEIGQQNNDVEESVQKRVDDGVQGRSDEDVQSLDDDVHSFDNRPDDDSDKRVSSKGRVIRAPSRLDL